jgi:Uma2 family endonuclease
VLVTAKDLLTLPHGMGKRYQLIAGRLHAMPAADWRHGEISANLALVLGAFIRERVLGLGLACGTGFLLYRNPDTVRAPDFAFIAKKNLPEKRPTEAYWPGAPDLAVEVLSPGDRMGEVDEKIEEWLAAGCAGVWVINPKLQTVTNYRSLTEVQINTSGDMLVGDPIVPGFSCKLSELFR